MVSVEDIVDTGMISQVDMAKAVVQELTAQDVLFH